MADDHIPAAVNVNAVVVVVSLVANGQVFQQHPVAVQIVFHPAGSGTKGYIVDVHVFAINDPHQEGTPGSAAAGFIPGEIRPGTLTIQLTAAADADVFAAFRKNQRLIHAHVGVLHGQAAGNMLRIVCQIRAGHQPTACLHHEPHIGAEHNGTGKIVAAAKQHRAALLSCRIHSRLNGCRCFRARLVSVFFRAEDGFAALPTSEGGGQSVRHGMKIFSQGCKPFRRSVLHGQHTVLFFQGNKAGMLLQVNVGGVEGQVHLSGKVTEDHAVPPIPAEQRLNLGEMAGNVSVIADGHSFRVPFGREACPQHQQLAFCGAPHGRTIRHVPISSAGTVMHQLCPLGIRCMEEQHGFPIGFGQIFRQGQGADFSVSHLHPFMGKDKIRFAGGADIQGSVQTFPVRGRNPSVRVGDKWPHGGICRQDGRSPAYPFLLEAGQHVQLAPVQVHFRCPVVSVCPEGAVIMEALKRSFPADHILTGVYVESVCFAPAGSTASAVEIILPVQGQYIRISNVDFLKPHGWIAPLQWSVLQVMFCLTEEKSCRMGKSTQESAFTFWSLSGRIAHDSSCPEGDVHNRRTEE